MNELSSLPTPNSHWLCTSIVEPANLPPVSGAIASKLKYYLGETPDTHRPLSVEKVIASVLKAEGRDPDELDKLLAEINRYQVGLS